MKWIVVCQIALNAIEHDVFRDFLSLFSAQMVELLPAVGDTIRRWIMDTYRIRKDKLIQELSSDSVSLVHVSFDLWTSPNSYAMMAVVIHYVDVEFKNRTRLIALRRLRGYHTGENMSVLLIEVIKEYGFQDRLGYFVTDNAGSNDVCIDLVLEALQPNLSAVQRSHRRLRCWGHIMNLAANAFLWGKEPESFEEEILIHSTLQREQQEIESWRKKGPVGKLHNIVVFTKRSPQRRETWQAIKAGQGFNKELLRDNATRWNSAYMMIKRALEVKDQIIIFIAISENEREASKRIDGADVLTREDWRILSDVGQILQPFYDQTKRLQSRAVHGHHGSLWEAFPSMEYLLRHILTAKEDYEHDDPVTPNGEDDDNTARARLHIKTSLDNCHGKLDRYYQLMDLSPAYAAAVVLHPGIGWPFFDTHWKSPMQRQWLSDAKKAVKKFWETSYKNREADLQPGDSAEHPLLAETRVTRPHDRDALEEFMCPPDFYRPTPTRVNKDEYSAYIQQEPAPTPNPLAWWRENRTRYPHLSRMALDLLSIPLMSAECERVFSSAKTLVTERRHRMKADIIEACTILRHYYKEKAEE